MSPPSRVSHTTERKPGIVFMVPGFPEDEQDTTCLPAVQNYIEAFAASRPDVDVHMIAFQYPFFRGEYAWKQATVHALGGMNRTSLRRMPTWARAIWTFMRLRKRTDVRVLHTFWLTECTRVGQWLRRAFGIRHVASIGGQDAQPTNPYLRHLRLDDLVLTAGSTFAADVFAKHSAGTPVHVIPLGLDARHLEAIDPPPERDIDVIGVGSLIPLKDYGAFVDIVAALTSDFPQVRACIIGDGPQQEALRAHIVRRGLQDNVALKGHLPRDEVFRYMLRSKVFLHTSKYESQGYVFLEALFAGLHVVCYEVGYTGKNDRVFRCRSSREIIDVATDLIRNPGGLLRQRVPTVEDTVRAFEAIYGD